MYNYCIAYDDGNILIRYREDGLIERYDNDQKKWIDDPEMSAIFTDEMPSRPISETQANSIIKGENNYD